MDPVGHALERGTRSAGQRVDPEQSSWAVILLGPTWWQSSVKATASELNGHVRFDSASSFLDALALLEQAGASTLMVYPAEGCELGRDRIASLGALTVRPRVIVDQRASGGIEDRDAVDDWLDSPIDAGSIARVLGVAYCASQAEQNNASSPVAMQHDMAMPGDVDLIDAVLAGDGSLVETLAEVVSRQTGMTGLSVALEESEVGEVQRRVAAEYGGQSYGWVYGSDSGWDAAALRPWSTWVARWLMLADRCRQMQDMAFRDPLTGAWNRRYFDRFLERVLGRAREERSQVTVMVFDIDNFKSYNDRYGHKAGDTILREAARLMQVVVRDHDVVARIGGDEFAVIFWDAAGPRSANSRHPQDVLHAARRFQKALCSHSFPELVNEVDGTLTISGGLAGYPWDGRTAGELLDHADQMSLMAKRQGKNAITFGRGAAEDCESF
ncbi:MAG: GGDEF domain-containing protein [Phycisphaeraceae bacterium]